MKKEIKEKVKKETKQKKVAVKKECPLIKEPSLKDNDTVTKEVLKKAILSGAIKEMVDLLKRMNNNHFLLSDEVKSIKKMISYDSDMTIQEQFADVHACISSVNKMREEFEDEQKRENQRLNTRLDYGKNVANSVRAIEKVIDHYKVNAEKVDKLEKKKKNILACHELNHYRETKRNNLILICFIALNFGITIFLLINFFTVFDF